MHVRVCVCLHACACTCVFFNLPYPQTRENFEKEYQDRLNKSTNITRDVGERYASFTYDATWAIGVALDAVVNDNISVTNFSSGDAALTDALTQKMQDVEFQGISVRLYIHSTLPHCCYHRVISSLRMVLVIG